MSIDYKRRVLTIAKQLPEMPADFELPMRLHRLAMVRGLVNDRSPVHFVVDTGGEVISISRSTLENDRGGATAPHPAEGVRHVGLGP